MKRLQKLVTTEDAPGMQLVNMIWHHRSPHSATELGFNTELSAVGFLTKPLNAQISTSQLLHFIINEYVPRDIQKQRIVKMQPTEARIFRVLPPECCAFE